MSIDVQSVSELVRGELGRLSAVRTEMNRVVVGQSYLIDRLLMGLLCDGHVLVEGLPGLAKTTAIKSLAACLEASFSRIQFTPDLLPADLVGTLIYNPAQAEFSVKKGPVFAHIILADEINRAPAKVQSALLEAMQERQVTIGTQSYTLDDPFLVMATQNPIEQQGTYPLPEAQVDRFMMKLRISYPTFDEEMEIMNRNGGGDPVTLKAVLTPTDIKHMRGVTEKIYLDDKLKRYILDIVTCSRSPEKYRLAKLKDFIACGASPRASINLARAARGHAFLQARGYVTPQDIKAVAPDVLRHRIMISYEAEAEELNADSLIKDILDHIDVP